MPAMLDAMRAAPALPAHLLLLTGAPASGKSQLAAVLARRYHACLCGKDEIKELLFDALGTGDAVHSRRLSDASFALLFAFLPRLLVPGRRVLLEGNFRPTEHAPRLLPLLAPEAVRCAQVWCRASLASRAARLRARATDPRRHPGHQDGIADPTAASGAGFLELPGPRWEFDSDAADQQGCTRLCAALDAWWGPAVDAND